MPFFQRYYLDIALLVISVLIVLELKSRKPIFSGGFIPVNETQLLLPALFLTSVAILFLRLFPFIFRFIAGESTSLIRLLVPTSMMAVGSAIVITQMFSVNKLEWIPSIALFTILTLTFWVTTQTRSNNIKVIGILVQIPTVILAIIVQPSVGDGIKIAITAVLVSIVVIQLIAVSYKALLKIVPVWIYLAFSYIARDPKQYTWISLLVVLGIGLATFTITTGVTLDKREQDKGMYEVPTDFRIEVRNVDGWNVFEQYRSIPNVTSVVSALKGTGSGIPNIHSSFKIFGVESAGFGSVAWYREDFSNTPLIELMDALDSNYPSQSITIPKHATRLGVWTKLGPKSATLSVEIVVRDINGINHTLDLGRLRERNWQQISTDIPDDLSHPVQFISLRVRPMAQGVPGTVVFDDIYAIVGPEGDTELLEDFEKENRWMALPTSMEFSSSKFSIVNDPHRGNKGGFYSLGQHSNKDVGGIYVSLGERSIPVILSSSLAKDSNMTIDSSFITKIGNAFVPMTVSNIVKYFPTMDPRNGGFIIADLDLLLKYMDILEPSMNRTPNEFFITVDPNHSMPEIIKSIRSLTPPSSKILNLHSPMSPTGETSNVNPTATAGWKAMAVVSLGIVVFTLTIGYFSYIVVTGTRDRVERDLLSSLGFFPKQVVGLLLIRHLLIGTIGMGLGIWAGLQMTDLAVPIIYPTDALASPLPPVVIATDWPLVVGVCVTSFVVFTTSILLSSRQIFDPKLSKIR